MRRVSCAVLVAAMTLGATTAHAQGDLRIRAARRDTVRAGSTVTGAFTVMNTTGDIVQVAPRIDAPADWSVLMGGVPFAIAPASTAMLMVSVVVPARAAAGVYALRVVVAAGVADSLSVLVPPRRALEVTLLDRPAFVVSGSSYQAGYLVRNRGNLAATLRISARSTLGRAVVGDTILHLDAEQSRVVRARVTTPSGVSAATDDVLELTVNNPADSAAPTHASARVTVVPEPSRDIEEFLRMPTQVNLRAASSDAVSPFEVFGSGPLRDRGTTQVDFLFRGPTGPYSAFGERDEYRVQLFTPSWRARVGDALYMMSPLTGGAQPGFGAGVDVARGAVTAGAFGQQFRRIPQKGTEAGGFVGVRPGDDARIALNYVSRQGGTLPGNVASAVAALDRELFSADLELARSQSTSGAGLARSARVSGSSVSYSYDIGHMHADTAFSGAQRGAEHTYATAHLAPFDPVSFSVSAGRHRSDLSRATGVPYFERLDVANLAATFFSRFTMEAGTVTRGTTVSGVTQRGDQRSVRARADQEMMFGLISLGAELGRAGDGLSPARGYSDLSASIRRSLARGSVSLWGDRYTGGSITKGAEGTVTIGGDASWRLSRLMDMSLLGYATRIRKPNAEWHSQVDALVSRILPNGNRVSLRARLMGGGSLSAADQSVAYLEYGIPLRLPVSRLRTPGRVYGRVVDAVSGSGVPGALVRLGPQVAITDKQGHVAFGGVPGGQHRLSMSQEMSFANAVFVGDPTLLVDSARAQPTTFLLAIARSARLDIGVRRFVAVRTGVAGAADSLADAGPLANATLVLAGERDTLYRTTTDDGRVSFTDVPPGSWVVSIRGDAPAFHRFDPDRVDLSLAPGETRSLAFRLVPRRRDVQLIGGEQELRNQAADPKPQPPPAVTPKVRKPDENRPETKRPDEKGGEHA